MRVIDPYDDNFAVLKEMKSTAEIPDFIKTASVLTDRERELLPDHCFALIMRDGEEEMRKFACVDKGSTALNAVYLMQNAKALPKVAQAKAARNLCIACSRFGLEIPVVLEKMAAQEQTRIIQSDAGHFTFEGFQKEAKGWDPWVDVTNKWSVQRPPEHNETVSFRGRDLPLDSYSQVKRAAEQFEQDWRAAHPKDRRHAALQIEKKASWLGIRTGPVLQKYAAQGLKNDDEIFEAFRERAQRWPEEVSTAAASVATELFEKRASMQPDQFAETLAEFDVSTGLDFYWDRYISDPWQATIGKTAGEEKVWELDTGTISASSLAELVAKKYNQIKEAFGKELADGLSKDPVSIFNSLPRDAQNAIASIGGSQ